MPAKSKKQQMAAGAALSAKRGQRPKKSLKGASKQMVESMSEKQLRDVAKTDRKKLPVKKTGAAPRKAAPKKAAAKKKAPAKKSPAAKKKSAGKKR